ncbi:Lso2p KNAG_0E03680 [Huiozyma naganishii CBS 8797]|uniref:LSO1/LSO2 domain-containing protein n=1 Tax=Huiozyma naganishii (strain ATCC MYA-139 / BCRC 22969 / CBS 8797 / KCTC 17520 / NBRC 10181 / NCYC 3082 / Yp74L-3) TaxID=1071383 RepID=J7R6Z0_HUIN7|nr:hypothetical protein KNAG_0E03680 [Kazachstania naganishii CBS 8797]CCK70625.1 hypothetical protein KNAG_0E03680 [Kazachstania naganishii CBS 8797]
MGKRFSESAEKKAAGQARKREQARQKELNERRAEEAAEAEKWTEGARTENSRKVEEEARRAAKLQAKKDREALLAAEEADMAGAKKAGKVKNRRKK